MTLRNACFNIDSLKALNPKGKYICQHGSKGY